MELGFYLIFPRIHGIDTEISLTAGINMASATLTTFLGMSLHPINASSSIISLIEFQVRPRSLGIWLAHPKGVD
jgi:hypothetical protein